MDREKIIRYQILRDCDPGFYTPLWECMSVVEHVYPTLGKQEQLAFGKRAVLDLLNAGFLALYVGSLFSHDKYTLLSKEESERLLSKECYWYSSTVPEKYIELDLTDLGTDICIGAVTYDDFLMGPSG